MAWSAPATSWAAPENKKEGLIAITVIGAQAAVLGEALFGVRGNWLYAAGAAGGAVAGGTLGAYCLPEDSRYLPAFLVATGIALLLPTALAIASAQFEEPISHPVSFQLHAPYFAVTASFTSENKLRFAQEPSSDFSLFLLNGTF